MQLLNRKQTLSPESAPKTSKLILKERDSQNKVNFIIPTSTRVLLNRNPRFPSMNPNKKPVSWEIPMQPMVPKCVKSTAADATPDQRQNPLEGRIPNSWDDGFDKV